MNLTLGIVLPVCNAEAKLKRYVQDLLDVLPDLATRFELLIVDERSTDQTADIAHELSLQYPQVKIVHQQPYATRQAAVNAAIASMNADVVFVQSPDEPLRTSDLTHALAHYQMPATGNLAVSNDLLGRLAAWGQALEVAAREHASLPNPQPPSDGRVDEPILRRAVRKRKKPPQTGASTTAAATEIRR